MPSNDGSTLPEYIGALILGLLTYVLSYLFPDMTNDGLRLAIAGAVAIVGWVVWHYVIGQRFKRFAHWLGRIWTTLLNRTFKKWLNRLLNKVMLTLKRLITKWHLSTEGKTKFLPISLFPGVGNSYLKSRYIAPPFGDVVLGNARFRLESDSLIFDTDEQIRYYLPRSDGGKEIDFQLPEPQNQVKSAYFLINSGNSKSIYAHKGIGEIRLVFKDAPPIVVELVLGENIREWCPGNPGDYVREASSPMITMDVWTGLSKGGANAVIDCLKIPVYECMRSCYLEKIIFVHKSPQQPSDTMGVHFSIFAMSLEIEQCIQN